MGLLDIVMQDAMRKNRLAGAAQASQGMLGTPVTTTGTLTSQEFDEFGQPINQMMTEQAPRQEFQGGFLGTQQDPAAFANLQRGLLGAGYQPQEVQQMTSMLEPAKAPAPTTFQRDFAAYQAADPTTRQGMLDWRKAGAQNISLGGGTGAIWTPEQVKAAGLAPNTVVTQDRYGKPQILTKEKFTQPQILSGGFALRMNTAGDDLANAQLTGFDPSTVKQNLDRFGIPEIWANYMRSPEGQAYRQGQLNWITANLRKESGAAIPEEETDREMVKWFPQPGDNENVIKQKARSRKDAESAMQKAAGGAYQELIDKQQRDRLNELRAKRGTN